MKRPQSLTDLINDTFTFSRADRVKAIRRLYGNIQSMSGTQKKEIADYILLKVCRQLIHEKARALRIKTANSGNLHHYPICTSKYLAHAFRSDLHMEIEWHQKHKETNANKEAMFQHILFGLPDDTTEVRDVYTNKDLESIYKMYIG